MKLRLTAALMVIAIVGAFIFAPLSAEAAKPGTSALNVPATGSVTDLATSTTTDITSINILDFVNQGGQLSAVVQLLDAAGGVLQTVTVPVTASGTCDILHLDLGPLHLDLLGLVIDLDQVVLDITAESGSGNLLGNLLCSVTHLLDTNASTSALAALLNSLLRALG